MIKPSTNRATAPIRSELVEYRNAAGLRVRAFLDLPTQAFADHYVVMAPKYGETKKNNLQLAYELAANGVGVLRFDLTNHIGESEGEMVDFTLPGAIADILASLEFLERKFDARNVTLLAASLSARCAIRAAALAPRLSRVVCLVGVVNLRQTVIDVYKEDIIGTYLDGRPWDVTNFLGFEVHAGRFTQAAVDADLHTLEGTIRDLRQTRVPIEYFYAEKDAWVAYRDVQAAFQGQPNCRLHAVADAMHELRENPRAADRVSAEIIARCLGGTVSAERVAPAPLPALLEQNRVERSRLRQIAPSADNEKGFWSEYFEKYKIVAHSPVFQEYLGKMGDMLGPTDAATTVLDDGCGNGLFGVWLLRQRSRHRGTAEIGPGLYVGVDLTTRGLTDSLWGHVANRAGFAAASRVMPGLLYTLSNFDELTDAGATAPATLPFAAGTFDRICCSLVISYLKHPERLLSELYRVLRAGGTVVISSMKPYCDMSGLYRTFVDGAVEHDEVESARDLLRAATTIRLKAEAGHYTFFTEDELAELARGAQFKVIECARSFGDQANLVKLLK